MDGLSCWSPSVKISAMVKSERAIVFLVDIDGTQNYAPPPMGTIFSLVMGELTLPPKVTSLEQRKQKSVIEKAASKFAHSLRPFTKDSLEGLEMINDIKLNEGVIQLNVLSGRDEELHEMTKAGLDNSGRINIFEEIYLNTSDSASGFKEYIVWQEAKKGNKVVLIDDDVKAALRAERVNEEFENDPVLVYLLKNFSNANWLLKRGKIELPKNVIRVNNFREAAMHFALKASKNIF